MKQYEAVIEVMRANDGYATLALLYQQVLKIPGVAWNTKTPFASIRRIVQTHDEFFRVKPGLWALEEYRASLPEEIFNKQPSDHSATAEYNDHTYYQGLLIQIGNMRSLETYIPAQDKNRLYLGKQPLKKLAHLTEMRNFGYSHLVAKASTIDVIWFNDRQMPERVFEVEHSTDMQNSLIKFVELQDFNIKFYVVSDMARKGLFEKRLNYSAFQPIQNRVKFLSYDFVAKWHGDTAAWRVNEDGLS